MERYRGYLVRGGSMKIRVEIKVSDGSHLVGTWNTIIRVN